MKGKSVQTASSFPLHFSCTHCKYLYCYHLNILSRATICTCRLINLLTHLRSKSSYRCICILMTVTVISVVICLCDRFTYDPVYIKSLKKLAIMLFYRFATLLSSASIEAYKCSFLSPDYQGLPDLPDCFQPLKSQMSVCTSSLRLCVLGTNFSHIEPPGEILSSGL